MSEQLTPLVSPATAEAVLYAIDNRIHTTPAHPLYPDGHIPFATKNNAGEPCDMSFLQVPAEKSRFGEVAFVTVKRQADRISSISSMYFLFPDGDEIRLQHFIPHPKAHGSIRAADLINPNLSAEEAVKNFMQAINDEAREGLTAEHSAGAGVVHEAEAQELLAMIERAKPLTQPDFWQRLFRRIVS